jgi:hypothetical protein
MATLALAAGIATAGTAHAASAGEPGIVATTTKGALVVLNPASGAVIRTLVSHGVDTATDEIAVSPDGRTVYFTALHGCTTDIESVPVTGGSPAVIGAGSYPALSQDGTQLSFAREPVQLSSCQSAPATGKQFTLVVRNLASGGTRTYPLPPYVSSSLPFPIAHLSWGPDGQLAVTTGGVQDNEGYGVVLIKPATARYFLPNVRYGRDGGPGGAIPVTAGPNLAFSAYAEGVFLPDGDLLADRISPVDEGTHLTPSSLLWEITLSGRLLHQVAATPADSQTTSLDADRSGHWLLYLSGSKLLISRNGATPASLARNLTAAAWL